MSAGEWIISIVLFIVALTALISIHEFGHFSMAKLFNVYCQEFSIGFGPAILKKKRKGGETYFCLRAIPLGGYVAMYGEDVQLEEGLNIPPERSIEGIKKWKKLIVLSAGVILNAILAFILIFVSNVAFPLNTTSSKTRVVENSVAYNAGVRDDYRFQIDYPKSNEIINEDGSISIRPFSAIYTNEKGSDVGVAFFIADSNVVFNERHYVLTYYPYTTKSDNNLADCLTMYVAATKEEVLSDKDLKATFENWISEENAPDYYPNFKQQFIYKNEEFSANLKFNLSPRGEEDNIKQYEISLKTVDGKLQDFGLYLKLETEWLPFDQRMKGTMSDFGSASIAVFKGIGTLFTGGLRNMSGIVGIYSYSAQLYGTQTFATYLYFWGLISINLAIFNLLPFPGLDGWQILVTSIEGITKKKIPSKAKTIMSFIGLALLFALMIAIVAMDVMRIVGVI